MIPKNYKKIQTADGSYTLYSETFNENCHSTSGAVEETKLHYLQACQVKEKSKTKDELNILEVGFGLGIGWETTYKNVRTPIKFISLELDGDLVDWAIKARHLRTEGLTVLKGDARETLPKYLKDNDIKFDCIYQDAFSPRRNPELWSVEWFKLLKSCSHEDTIMSTYSASSSIRKSMIEAGWKLSEGKQFGTKKTATIAKISGETEKSILDKMERSPAITLRESNIDEYRKIE